VEPNPLTPHQRRRQDVPGARGLAIADETPPQHRETKQ